MVVNLRMLAIDSLIEIMEKNRHSHLVIGEVLNKYSYIEKQERAFYQRLTFGTIERMIYLDYVIEQFSSKPVKKMRPVVRYILRTGVYQIIYMDFVPDSAACNEAVKIAKKRGFSSLSGFINAILRKVCANKDTLSLPDMEKEPEKYLSVVNSTPLWIVQMLYEKYGFETTKKVLEQSLETKNTTIRCNRDRIDIEKLHAKLIEQGISVERGNYVSDALIIKNFDNIYDIYGYEEGYFYVQDESSMLAVLGAGIDREDTVIDVCAAPGGKSLFAAQFAKNGRVISRDLTESKTDIIRENAARLGVSNITIETKDALVLDEEYVGKADVVLADLPCSGLGIIGKKPDIKYKVTKEQTLELAKLQKDILKVVASYVKPGGVMIFSTCTINPYENEKNIQWITNNLDFVTESLSGYIPEELVGSEGSNGYVTFLPGIHKCDGFFIARLRRKECDNNDRK